MLNMIVSSPMRVVAHFPCGKTRRIPFFSLPATTTTPIVRLSSSLSTVSDKYDLVVIGGGVVGAQAAVAAASLPYNKKVCLVDAPRASGALMNETTNQDLSFGAPTGLFSKALRDTSKRIRVSQLRGMGLRDDR